jgi:hypothetical protein
MKTRTLAVGTLFLTATLALRTDAFDFNRPFHGVSTRTPLGHTGLGVTTRTPIGRNGLGYKPFQKPLGNNGKNLEKWVSDNREAIIVAAATIVAIAIVQPELAAITWSDVGLVVTSDGVAVGISVTERAAGKGSSQKAPETRYDLPLWPVGVTPDLFDTLKKQSPTDTGLNHPLIAPLLKALSDPETHKAMKAVVDGMQKIEWPVQCDPGFMKEIIQTQRESFAWGEYVYSYAKEKKTIRGIEDTPKMKKMLAQSLVRTHSLIAAVDKLTPEQYQACMRALEELKKDPSKVKFRK